MGVSDLRKHAANMLKYCSEHNHRPQVTSSLGRKYHDIKMYMDRNREASDMEISIAWATLQGYPSLGEYKYQQRLKKMTEQQRQAELLVPRTFEEHVLCAALGVTPVTVRTMAFDTKIVKSWCKKLKPTRQKVLRHRMVPKDNQPTLKAVGDIMNLTRERVRQIENDALNKVRVEYISYRSKHNPGKPSLDSTIYDLPLHTSILVSLHESKIATLGSLLSVSQEDMQIVLSGRKTLINEVNDYIASLKEVITEKP